MYIFVVKNQIMRSLDPCNFHSSDRGDEVLCSCPGYFFYCYNMQEFFGTGTMQKSDEKTVPVLRKFIEICIFLKKD